MKHVIHASLNLPVYILVDLFFASHLEGQETVQSMSIEKGS